MKIGIICYNHFDATISLGKYLREVYPEAKVHFLFLMSQSFLDVEMLNLDGAGLPNGFVDPKDISRVVDKEVLHYLKGRATFDVFIFNSYKIADVKNIKLLFELKKVIAKQAYDVLHFVGNNPWVIFLNALFIKTPKVHTLHEPYPFGASTTYYRLLRHKLKIKLLIKTGSYIILPSKISYQRFADHFSSKPHRFGIIPFGPLEIYKMYEEPGVVRENYLALYYGNISPYKGIEVLIAAMQKAVKKNRKLKLIIAGMGEFNYVVSPLLGELTVINRYLTNHEIAALNQKAAVVVCPYTSASQSGVVMTSYAFDNPIIATNVGAMAEFVESEKTGILVPPNDIDALSEAILKFFEDESHMQEMRHQIHHKYLYADVSWPKIAEQMLQLYNSEIKSYT